jgi:citrate lyase synthetase
MSKLPCKIQLQLFIFWVKRFIQGMPFIAPKAVVGGRWYEQRQVSACMYSISTTIFRLFTVDMVEACHRYIGV